MSVRPLITAVFWFSTMIGGPSAAQTDALLPEELILLLQGGGYVVYVVHTETSREQDFDAARAPEGQCKPPLGLTVMGQAKAVAIGGGFDRLDIPVGEVLVGDCCAAWQMSRLAFEDATIRVRPEEIALSEARYPGWSDPRMHGPIPAGRADNLVLIGHSEALEAVVDGVSDMPGLAHVLAVRDGAFVLEGIIPPDAWLGF